MNIAIVLYGQPREHIKGYNNILEFMNKNKDCKFDFFYHCWKLNENGYYSGSSWRPIDKNTLVYNENVIPELQNLYNPIAFEVDNQSDCMVDESYYQGTMAFNNTAEYKIPNIPNTLFQMYSRNMARKVLNAYLEKINNKEKYDFVISLRFDIGVLPDLNMNELDKSKVYVSSNLCPRKILPDLMLIMSPSIFLEWFNYDTLKEDVLDNTDLLEKIRNFNENIDITHEEIMFAKYIFHYKNTDNILYFYGGFSL